MSLSESTSPVSFVIPDLSEMPSEKVLRHHLAFSRLAGCPDQFNTKHTGIVISTCLSGGWPSMKQHHLVGLIKVWSQTKSHRLLYGSPGSEAGSPRVLTWMWVRARMASVQTRGGLGEEGSPFPNLNDTHLHSPGYIAKHATE